MASDRPKHGSQRKAVDGYAGAHGPLLRMVPGKGYLLSGGFRLGRGSVCVELDRGIKEP